jgi:hypothetical protein
MRRDDLPSEELDEAAIERLAESRRLASGYREAARRALAFARRYRIEEGFAGSEREMACVAQALEWRRAARDAAAGGSARPGLARTRPLFEESAPPSRKAAG